MSWFWKVLFKALHDYLSTAHDLQTNCQVQQFIKYQIYSPGRSPAIYLLPQKVSTFLIRAELFVPTQPDLPYSHWKEVKETVLLFQIWDAPP